ncbi:MAG TPA: hypothetical protein VNQ90_09345 [Chthoniobacteraceae bacterium]|nr:hypothetical protein [Chthoniobacteraceae bacterium]
MKTSFLTATAAALLCMGSLSPAATILTPSDWYAYFHVVGNPPPVITNGDTGSPTLDPKGATSIIGMFSYFDPTTLHDGQTLKLSFDIAYELAGGATEKSFTLFRFGLYNSSTPKASIEQYGEGRVAGNNDISGGTKSNWSGFMLSSPGDITTNDPSAASLNVSRKGGTGDQAFSSTADQTLAGQAGTTGDYTLKFQDGVPRTYTLELTREGTTLHLSGTYGSGSFNGTLANAFTAEKYELFDAVGFYASSNSVGIDKLTFSNVTVTVVPEASTNAMLFGGGILLAWAARHRRNQRKTTP